MNGRQIMLRVCQLLKNFRLTLATVLQHSGDDPVVLVLQASRRMPGGLVRGAAELVYRLSFRARVSDIRAVAAYLAGRHAELREILCEAYRRNVKGAPAARLADVAIATGEMTSAASLLKAARKEAARYSGTMARYRWYQGDMTGAVAELVGTTGNEAKQRRRLASELSVFQEWRPTIAPVAAPPNRKHVLHVLTNSLPHTGSGYAQRSHSIMVAQRELGWDVRATTRLGYPVQIGRLLANSVDYVDGIEYHRLLPWSMREGLSGRLQQQTEALAEMVRQYRPAVLHTTTHFVNGLVVAEVARKAGIPWVYEVRGQLADTWAATRSEEAAFSERYKLFKSREIEVMRQADLVVTLGAGMRDQIAQGDNGLKDVLIAPNAVGEQYREPPLSPEKARTILGLDPAEMLVGTVSSLVDYEGVDDLIAAFTQLAPQYPTLRLLIVGDGVSLPLLRRRAELSGFTQRVTFTGRVPRDCARLYQQALDIFVVPRKDSAVTRSVTPLKPVEALASARPVVASDLPALTEIVKHGENGLLVRAESPESLADAIGTLVENGTLRRSLGMNGREGVLATRTWQLNAEKYASAYQRIGVMC